MIRGTVQVSRTESGIVLLAPRITVSIAGGSRVFQTEEVTVDTGFTGWLTLPEYRIKELGLTSYGRRRAVLANDEEITSEVYSALVSWHGQLHSALVYQVDATPLMGMALLTGNRLIIAAFPCVDVVIEEVPR